MPPVAAPPRQQQPHQPAPAAQPSSFEQIHPRGRGGKWILKPGAGQGAGGPDQTTAQLQQRLKQLGFNVPQNGQYDAATAAAVASFQTRYGLDPHGGVDAATLAVLQNPPSSTLAQTQKALGLTAKGTPKPTKGAKKAKKASSTGTTRKVKGGAQTASQRVTGAATARSLGTGSLAQGQGMTGAPNKNVQSLQKALTVAGYSTNQDGRFGPQTEASVKQLQAAHGLTADGVVGPETKGLLIGLQSAKATPNRKVAAKKAKKTAPTKKIPGQPAVLRTKAPTPRHGSRTAGSRMKLAPPKKAPATLKYHAEQPIEKETAVTRIKRLEEGTWTGGNAVPNTSTVAFGTGGVPSMSIKDGRDTEPDYDKPIWTITGVHANPPDETIYDGRTPSPPRIRSSLVIPDGRGYDSTQGGPMVTLNETDLAPDPWYQLQEAVLDRQEAASSTDFVRAFAREQVLRRQLEERDVSTKERATLESKGHAMKGGRYPIKHVGDLKAAIKAFGRGNPPDKAAIKAHIIQQAKRLKLTALLPDTWTAGAAAAAA